MRGYFRNRSIESESAAPELPGQPAASSSLTTPTERASDRLLLLLLVLCACLPYLNILLNGFVYDDDQQVLQNPYIRNFHYLKPIFTNTVWWFRGGASAVTNYYRPVMTFGYLLCHEVFGFRAWGFHLASLALNAGVVCLLFIVTRRMFHNRLLAFLAAALFALYPIHTEAVDWIAAVTDLELALFFLLAFWFFLRLEDSRGGKAVLLQLGMAVSFVLALLSKEPAAALPLLATFYEHACREDRSRTRWTTKLSRYGGFWVLLGAYVLVRVHLLGAFVPSAERPHMLYGQVFLAAISLAGHYFGKMIWPVHLSASYPFPRNIAGFLPGFFAGAAALLVCAWAVIHFWNRDRRICFGIVWFFITLAPVLNARWLPATVFSERYLYLPSAGLCWVAAWLGVRAWRRVSGARNVWRQALVGAACILAALLAARIVVRNPVWKSDFTLYTRTLADSPNSAIIHNNLGIYYSEHNDLKDAGEQWNQALKLMPNAPFVLNNLGILNLRLHHYPDAVVFYQRALALSPHDVSAHAGLGQVYKAMGLRGKAESEFREAIKLAPLDVEARLHLGQLYYDERRYDQAENAFQASVKLLPTVWGYSGLAIVRWAKGDHTGAKRLFVQAMKLDPTDARPYFLEAVLDVSSGRAADAMREYQAGLKIDPTNTLARAQLALLERRALPARRVQP